MIRIRYCIALLSLFAAAPAWAQPSPGDEVLVEMEPLSIDTITVRFQGRTLAAINNVNVHARTLKNADVAPSAIKVATAYSGSDVLITLNPDAGCGTSGCRAGNLYQIRVQAQDSSGNRPTFNFLVKVKWQYLTL